MPAGPSFAPLYRTTEIRALEARHVADGLMERAGAAAEPVARALMSERGGPVVVLAGPGNNGGDGFVLARRLRESFHDVAVVFAGDPAALPDDAARARASYVDGGGTIVAAPPSTRPALIVDALFGLGLTRAVAGPHASLVHWANAQAAPTLALDIPTGLGSDTGAIAGPAIHAQATATFIAMKPGLVTGEGPDRCGRISVHPLGIDARRELEPAGCLLDWRNVVRSIAPPFDRSARTAHKGTFGTLGIVGGNRGMVGAVLLAGRAALRTGAGKIRIGFVAPDFPAVDLEAPELMLGHAGDVLARGADAWVVGCGLGDGDASREALSGLLARDAPLVVDADALNLIATDDSLRASTRARAAATIATPHPAEAARLLACTAHDVQRDRLQSAFAIARDLAAHVVLKGAGTVIAHPDGRFDINASGGPALAFGGSGDVLAGMLGAWLAQTRDPVIASRIAVCLHGAAADALVARGVGPIGLSARELGDAARDLLNGAG
jgi:hydroxyethylthiazole kinase-like uncharacterized protein yjeF